eukprot:SAG25_NODE_7568_length_472_cov_1.710456_1_plen_54_part_10
MYVPQRTDCLLTPNASLCPLPVICTKICSIRSNSKTKKGHGHGLPACWPAPLRL